MIALIIAALVGLYAVYVLVRSGGQLFGVEALGPEQKKRAWRQGLIAALALLLCVFWYKQVYNGEAAQKARFEALQHTRCTDVLEAYKAAQILVKEASKDSYSLAFTFVPTHQSKVLSPCEFFIEASADRVSLATGVSDKALFAAQLSYDKSNDAWKLQDLQWQQPTSEP